MKFLLAVGLFILSAACTAPAESRHLQEHLVPADVVTKVVEPSTDPARCDEKGQENCLSLQLMHLMHTNQLAALIEDNRGNEGEVVRKYFASAQVANATCGVLYFWMKPSWGDKNLPAEMMSEVRFSRTGGQNFYPVEEILHRGSLPTIEDPRYPNLSVAEFGFLGRPGPAGVGWTMPKSLMQHIEFLMYCPCEASSWPRRAAPGQREGLIWTGSQLKAAVNKGWEYIIDPVLVLPPNFDFRDIKIPK